MSLLSQLKGLFGGPVPCERPIRPVAPSQPLANPKAFFDSLRASRLLGSGLEQGEVNGLNALLGACHAARWPVSYTAYALATAFHETAGTMQPIRELGSRAYLTLNYDVTGRNPIRARKMGNTSPGDGVLYCGRGYVQLTWKVNYQKAGTKLGVDLVNNPAMAMQPDIAAKIMVHGMEEGWFTGRDLDDDLPVRGPAGIEAFVRSRDIINGTDKARKIAAEAVTFQRALIEGGWREVA
jgi:putative chitinase